ncbi:MAG: PSP1 C-terminal domain-containing protein [Planctomycetota bacterium]
MAIHFVRVGQSGQVGSFVTAGVSPSLADLPRGTRVVCETDRGLEVGEVISPAESLQDSSTDGRIIRRVTVEDELLLARVARYQQEAFAECSRLVAERGIPALLMDVEHLLDGRSLFFYFLGEVTPELDALTAELAERYDTVVRFRQFSETLETGCGPGCGTEEGAGCGASSSGSCSTCQLATACHKSSS